METRNVVASIIVTAPALTFSTANAAVPSNDPRYEEFREIMRDYVQRLVKEDCTQIEDFDFTHTDGMFTRFKL